MPRTSLPLSLLLPLVVALSPASALAGEITAYDAGSSSAHLAEDGSSEGGVLAQAGDRADRSSAQKKGRGSSKSSSKKDSKKDSKGSAPKSADSKGGSSSSASRPSSASPSSASPSHRSPAPYARGDDRAAAPARDLATARPAPGPVTRAVSVGSGSTRPAASSVHAVSASPANFRSTTARSGADRGTADRGTADRGTADRGAAAERHGAGHGGSDAERARHAEGRHEATARHTEAARRAEVSRHAQATAAHHRHAASYRPRSAASRHRAWASHARGGHWYAPGSWFRPYRAGHARWYHGVFVYGPGPRYGHAGSGGQSDGAGSADRVPERKVDRARTFAIGVRGGSYMGGYSAEGGGFGDAGLGVAARYRLTEAVGLEVSWMHHNQTWDDGSERVYQPIQGSVQLFGMPWTKVNPYLLAGVTVAGRQVHDNLGFTQVDEAGTLVGPHAGLGIEFGLGKKASINFDARYTGYLNKPAADLTIPGAVQANMGLNFYF